MIFKTSAVEGEDFKFPVVSSLLEQAHFLIGPKAAVHRKFILSTTCRNEEQVHQTIARAHESGDEA